MPTTLLLAHPDLKPSGKELVELTDSFPFQIALVRFNHGSLPSFAFWWPLFCFAVAVANFVAADRN